jgi:putative hydrolase of the HAD superfamily
VKDVDALLFDLGGVIIDVDFARVTDRWAALAGADPAALRKRFALDDAYRRHERGEIDAKAYFAALRSSLGLPLSDAQFLDGWNAIFSGVIPGIEPLLAQASTRYPLYVFSNTNPAHADYWVPLYAEALKPFRKVFLSSSIGLRKPDAAAFHHVARDIGVAPERILFFDDTAENVAGAAVAGLQAIRVRSNDDVAAAISALFATTS